MDLLPYTVRYKAGTDRRIKPGIHGKFRTREEAETQAEEARKHFSLGREIPTGKEAVVFIDVDETQAKQVAAEEGDQCEAELSTGDDSTQRPANMSKPQPTKSMAKA